MAQYINISIEEMNEFLISQGFVRVHPEKTVEAVYGKRVEQDNLQLTLRVYTGINPDGNSREVGKDAIRVNLFIRGSDGVIVKLGGSKRVHRVVNWRKNLQSRLDDWLAYMPKHKCSKCGMPMVPRKGKNGNFLGCAAYPTCFNTMSTKEENEQ